MTRSFHTLVWAPTGRDAELATRLLRHHDVEATIITHLDALITGIESAGCAVVAAEALARGASATLAAALAKQPAWSDFPLLLLSRPNSKSDRAADATEAAALLGNVTLLERPLRAATLLSAVGAARRARQRQYEAREAIHRRDQFLAMLGHELRNPLAAIVLALESLAMITPSTGDKQRTIIDRQARHLSRLVDDLLDVARVTTGKVTLQLAHVELGDIIRRCVQGAELSARAHSIRLRAAIDATPMGVLGDAVRLEEIVNNLVTNAIKYSPANSTVDITGHCDGTDCVVVIRDRGIGLAPDMLPRVFDLFAQAESSLARSQGGLGIGLTLVRALVELHHGTVTASSPGLGQGSTFEVRLPHHPATAEHAPQRPATSAASARIVLVDDNIDILEMTCELLQRYGCEVITASDGNTGIAAITEHAPDIAIVDIGLPGTDGYEVARTIRASGTRPYLVALTGYGQRSDRERALAAGFDEHLIKPIDFERLRTLISQHAHNQRGTIAT